MHNKDDLVVEGFGEEWTRFDQHSLSDSELHSMFDDYFHIFPWSDLPNDAFGLDLGCGSGRWARFVAPRVGRLHCVDASDAALFVARRALADATNCTFECASVDAIGIDDNSADFGYSIGVLHLVPDTEAGLRACIAKLKPGAPFLLYLYYDFSDRALWFRTLGVLTRFPRIVISRLPPAMRSLLTQMIAACVYYPLARASLLLERAGANVRDFPLSIYRSRTFYVMRNDALDRFGTRIEKRFSREAIEQMMQRCGLTSINFSNRPPFWTAVGIKERPT